MSTNKTTKKAPTKRATNAKHAPSTPPKEAAATVSISEPAADAKPPAVKSLADFGVSSPAKTSNDNLLIAAFVKGPASAIVWRIVGALEQFGYLERFLFEALCIPGKKLDWVQALNFHPQVDKYVDHGVPIMNGKNFPVRVFSMPVETLPSKKTTLDIGMYIADNINQMEDKPAKLKLLVDPNRFFWSASPLVWSEVISPQVAYDRLVKRTGEPSTQPDFFEKHRELILGFFAEGGTPSNIARRIHAPNFMVDPSTVEEAHVEEEKEEGEEE